MQALADLEEGREFAVKGQGTFRVVKRRPNGEVNAWGPLGRWQQKMRTFRPDQAVTVKRQPKEDA